MNIFFWNTINPKGIYYTKKLYHAHFVAVDDISYYATLSGMLVLLKGYISCFIFNLNSNVLKLKCSYMEHSCFIKIVPGIKMYVKMQQGIYKN